MQRAIATRLFMIGLAGAVIKMFTTAHWNELVITSLNHIIPHLTDFFLQSVLSVSVEFLIYMHLLISHDTTRSGVHSCIPAI